MFRHAGYAQKCQTNAQKNPKVSLRLQFLRFSFLGDVDDLEDAVGKRGPLKKSALMGAAYLKAKAQADAERQTHDADQLLTLPSGLTSGAKRRWMTLAPLLLEDGRLTVDTRETLVNFVRLADEADVLGEQLTAEGVVLTTPHGAIANPKAKILAGIRSTLLRYSQACGLDPVSRARLGTAGVIDLRSPEQKREDAEFSQFFG
jgi:P27 family predicted phage terminase small subunit